jgi:hypothetical protein
MSQNALPKIVPLYEIMWENMVEGERPQMKTQHGGENMQFA